jgi:hypothetical protein
MSAVPRGALERLRDLVAPGPAVLPAGLRAGA